MNSILERISSNECVDILKKKLKSCVFQVNSYKVHPLDEVKGFLGDYCHLDIDYCHENKDDIARFFVKIKSASGHRQDLLNENGLFTKECQFYQKLVCDISESGVGIIHDCVPQCYMVSNDRYLIFEDLETKGYVNVDIRASKNLDYIKSGLDALVKLHCSGLIYEEIMEKTLEKSFKIPQNYPEILAESLFCHTKISRRFIEAIKEGTETLIDLYYENADVDYRQFKELALGIYENLSEAVQPSNLYRNTICHGDLWSPNIMSKFKDGNAVHSYIIDYQTLRYAPPGQDFMAYLYFTTDKEFREEHMQNLIEYYYEKMAGLFRRYGLSPTRIISREEFVESCNYYQLLACALATNHHQLIMFPPDALRRLAEQGIMQNLIFGDRPAVIRDFWKTDDFYREKMKENLSELRGLLIENQNYN